MSHLSADKKRLRTLMPFLVLALTFAVFLPALKNGGITAGDWTKQCAELGIAGMDLAEVGEY